MLNRNAENYNDPTAGKALGNIAKEKREEKKRELLREHDVLYWPKVYVVSKYAGDVKRNRKRAIDFCKFAMQYKYTPIASHLLYPQILNDSDAEERKLGLKLGLALLALSDEVWCFGMEISAGMKQELIEAQRLGKRIRYFTLGMEEIK